MLTERKLLPPLDHLLAFEAAAKAGSFARAADILHISESAISRKVRLLELHYNLPLFVRGHRSISMTDHGAWLLQRVEQSMDNLRDASRELFQHNGSSTVRVAATNSVAALWLMPRLHRFNRANAQVRIMLVASDSDAECMNDTNDLVILRGEGDWPGFEARLLFGETVYPVCSPEYLRRNAGAGDITTLPELDLIEVRSSHAEWMDWKHWFSHQQMSPDILEQTAVFNTYPLAVQAAADGLGVALGWGHLVDRHLENGTLVRPLGNAHARTQSGYYLLKSTVKSGFAERDIVENWLIGISEARRRYG